MRAVPCAPAQLRRLCAAGLVLRQRCSTMTAARPRPTEVSQTAIRSVLGTLHAHNAQPQITLQVVCDNQRRPLSAYTQLDRECFNVPDVGSPEV